MLLVAPGVLLGVPGDLLGSSWVFVGAPVAPGVLPGIAPAGELAAGCLWVHLVLMG